MDKYVSIENVGMTFETKQAAVSSRSRTST